MNISLISETSFWWLTLIIIVSGALSWLFYFYKSGFSEMSKTKLLILSVLRFFCLFFVGFIMLNPLIKSITKKEIKPTVLVAHDNSSSILNSTDSLFYKTEYKAKLQQLILDLEGKYNVELLSFGSVITKGISFEFDEKLSNFIPLYQDIKNKYLKKNIGAIVLATDGIYNRGANPEKLFSGLKTPVYSIALGDTNIIRDIQIDKLEFNTEVYKGNKTPVFVYLKANGLQGRSTMLTLKKNDTILETREIRINEKDFFEKHTFQVETNEQGLNRFDFLISNIEGESINENNKKSAFINVSETKKKILLIQNGWHPDIGTIHSALNSNDAFEFKVVDASKGVDDISDYDLIILHQLPSDKYGVSKVIKHIITESKPLLLVFGQQTSVKALNQCNLAVDIRNFKNIYDNSNIGLNNQFSLFKLDIEESVVRQFSPLTVPFADFPPANINQVLFYQSVGTLATAKPLIYFPDLGTHKIGIICGEGIWRWPLQEYNYTQSHNISYQIIQKSIQYLLSNDKKKRFIVDIPTIADEGQPMNIIAKVYNPSFELITSPTVNFSLFDDKGNEFPYFFEEGQLDYKLRISSLSKGKYYYKASTSVGNEQFIKKGSFFVQEMQIENQEMQANHNLLYKISNNTGGKMFMPDNCSKIGTEIDNNPNISTIVYPMKGISVLIDKKFLFVLILLLVSVEWFLRKLWGFR